MGLNLRMVMVRPPCSWVVVSRISFRGDDEFGFRRLGRRWRAVRDVAENAGGG